MRELQDQYATVNLLVVTDNQFYQDQDNWKTVAQDIVAEANRQFDRDDIRVTLCVMAYTDSKRVQLSNHSNITSNPVVAVQAIYPNTDLDLWAADIALYVGGYDADGSAQGGLLTATTHIIIGMPGLRWSLTTSCTWVPHTAAGA
ncbi:hypothetical protein [Methanoculleus chikugoensis]|uniref:hypothetical protein n=1 Tax=Methanoculleus chikugoensis TaxID=118126 RepID=UPI0006D07F5F|nr:hypothetical protein [Methanoculleus chikugoensis]